jgi:hypothetical protein
MESIGKLPASGRLPLEPMASSFAQPPVLHSFGISAGINRLTRNGNGIRNGMGKRFSPVFTGLVADVRIQAFLLDNRTGSPTAHNSSSNNPLVQIPDSHTLHESYCVALFRRIHHRPVVAESAPDRSCRSVS